MEERDQTIGFRVTKSERTTLENAAQRAGVTLAEYARTKVLSSDRTTATDDLEALVKHCIYIVNQTHDAVFSIAEAQGNARRFLTTEELEEVYREVQARVLAYAVEFPKKFAALRDEIMAAGQKQSN
jgi:hypothetical protein